jgi:Protein kinase domain
MGVQGLQSGDPERIGPYMLLGRLGQGHTGLVFLGQSADGRAVAVKVIRPDLATDNEFRARFRRAVSAAKKVSGPFTAEVVDTDATGPQPWLATAYVAGPSLAEVVRQDGPLPRNSLMTLAAALAAGLSAIEAAGLVHGDLKPANVLMAEDGPRMINVGTAQGDAAGASSDVFRLGLVLGFAATGHEPPEAGYAGYPDLDQVPPEIRSLAGRCLAQVPGQRPTLAELVAEIGPARPGVDWLPTSITGGIAGYMLPAAATSPDLPVIRPAAAPPAAMPPAAEPSSAGRRTGVRTAGAHTAGARDRQSSRRILITAGAVAAAAAIAVTLIVVTLTGRSSQPQAASRPTQPAAAHRSPKPTPTPVPLAAWSAGQRVGHAEAFAAISCPAATFCLAADSGGNVYTYSSGRWSGPNQLVSGALTSVSCATAGFCAATGPDGRAYVYADGTWSAPSELTGADGHPADLKWVSCPETGFCVAAGKWDAYTYSGGQWAQGYQIQQTRTFASISCPAATFCLATDSGGNVYTYSGGHWSGPRQLTDGALTSVSCATISFCAATGPDGRAYVYADGTWSAPSQLTDTDGNPTNLRSVSCPSAGICLATGTLDAYTYSAGTWAAGQLIQKDSSLTSISCPAARFCVAADTGGDVYTYSASAG